MHPLRTFVPGASGGWTRDRTGWARTVASGVGMSRDAEDRSVASEAEEGRDTGPASTDDAPDSTGQTDRRAEPRSRPEPAERHTDADSLTETQPDAEELPAPARGLDSRVRLIWALRATVSAVVVGAITGVGGMLVFDRPLVGVGVFLALLIVGNIHAWYRYRRWSYQVRADSLLLTRGVFTRTKTVVPYVRIQHVDASRGPAERLLGIATTVVYTAGSRGADVSIPGLTQAGAEALQTRLKRLAIAAEGEDAV